MILQKPNTIVEVTLPFQSNIPEPDRLRFKVRALSWGEAIDYDKEFERILGLPLVDQFAPLMALIRIVATDWSNAVDAAGQPLPFADESFRLMTPELMQTVAAQLREAASWGSQKKVG